MPKLIQEILYFIYTAADYRFSMQYSLVGARFTVLSTLPLGHTHPPIPLVLMVILTTHPYLAPR
jgi:hypothetical protein